MLLATLVVLCGLVLVMRAMLTEEQLALRMRGSFRYGAGLLTEEQLTAAVEAELSRAARHGRPLSLVMVEVTGSLAQQIESGQEQRLVTAIARGVLGRIRVEDSAAHLGGLRFAVMTPETTAPGAAAVAGTVADMVRRRLISAGYDGGNFEVAVGWADFPSTAENAPDLVVGHHGLAGARRPRPLGRRAGPPGNAPPRSRPLIEPSISLAGNGRGAPWVRGGSNPRFGIPRRMREDAAAMSDRLTALDASFLHLEDGSSHMHVAGVSIFEGEAPSYDDFLGHIEQRLSLVPRFRQKLRFVPFSQGRPVWVDDPHFNLRYHVRATALPAAGQRGAAEEPREPRVRAAARPHEAAVGDLAGRGTRPPQRRLASGRERRRPARRPAAALRAAVEDASRARRRRRRRGHHGGAVRHRGRAGDSARRRPTWVPRPEPTSDAVARRRADRALDPARGDRSLRAVRLPRAARLVSKGIDSLAAVGALAAHRARRSPHSAERGDRAAPPVRLGPHRPRRDQGRSRTRSAAR